MSKKPVKYVHINNIEYSYIIGRGNIVIRLPNRQRILTDMSEVSGWDWDSIERGIRKRYFSITPGMIKRWLEMYLKLQASFSIWIPGWHIK